MNGKNVDEMAELLEATIKKALDEIVPIETKKVRVHKINRLMTKGIKVSVNNAQSLYKKGKKNRNLSEYNKIMNSTLDV